MADYSILEQVKIRLRQFHVDDDDTVVFDKKEENPAPAANMGGGMGGMY